MDQVVFQNWKFSVSQGSKSLGREVSNRRGDGNSYSPDEKDGHISVHGRGLYYLVIFFLVVCMHLDFDSKVCSFLFLHKVF